MMRPATSVEMKMLDLKIDDLIDGRVGTHDIPCPVCDPYRRQANQRRRTLRIWRQPDGFATYRCVHCEIKGYQLAPGARLTRSEIETASRRHELRRSEEIERSREVARALWARRRPIRGTIAEVYLRECRGYSGALPSTLGYLAARDEYPPAMIAAFGVARETEPGTIATDDAAVVGVHLTRLRPDGLGKADGEAAKITIGREHTGPIMLHAPNDLLGLIVAEGIEDGLSAHEALGMGAWAAGCASRLPRLAEHVPHYIEVVTVLVDIDRDGTGERHAGELAARLDQRGIEVRLVPLGAAE